MLKKSLIMTTLLILLISFSHLIFFDGKTYLAFGEIYIPAFEQLSLDKKITYSDSFMEVDSKGLISGHLESSFNTIYFEGVVEDDGAILPLPKLHSTGTISGFASSNELGIISFSSSLSGTKITPDTQGPLDYGVFLQDDKLLGYAWSDRVGWLCFGGCTIVKQDFNFSLISKN